MKLQPPEQGRLPFFAGTADRQTSDTDSIGYDDYNLQMAIAHAYEASSPDEQDPHMHYLYDVAKMTQEHLINAQNQPFMAVNVVRDPETRKIIIISGVAGCLADSEQLVGLHSDDNNNLSSGIKTHGFSHFIIDDKRKSLFGPENDSGVIPLLSNDFSLGDYVGNKDQGPVSGQEILAGGDIAEWLSENFEDIDERYKVFSAVISSIFRVGTNVPSTADASGLFDSELVAMARNELSYFNRVKALIDKGKSQVKKAILTNPDHDTSTERGRLIASLQGRVIDGIIADAELSLMIASEHSPHEFAEALVSNPNISGLEHSAHEPLNRQRDVSIAAILTSDDDTTDKLQDYYTAPLKQFLDRVPFN